MTDEIERLRAELTSARGLITAVVHTAGGIVEGYPTSEINILQRIRHLVEIESAFALSQAKRGGGQS